MKVARFQIKDGVQLYGTVEGRELMVIDGLYSANPSGESYLLEDVKLLPPTTPSKIVCIGLNYIDHAHELGMAIPEEPIIFIKPATAAIGPEDEIVYPKAVKHLDYEAELGVVISRRCKDVRSEDAEDVIAGYTAFNDVTARDLQKKDGQWTRSKSFDTFAPMGPWIATKDEIGDPHRLNIELRLNGDVKQRSNTRNLIFKIPDLIEFISNIMTLESGDVIATGTPPGVGPMEVGDSVEVEIEGIGILRNHVISS
ncbi:MAG: fumarylacetoacetate hydrolase family protein [Candidatus Hydrothermarchaeales archaeon]